MSRVLILITKLAVDAVALSAACYIMIATLTLHYASQNDHNTNRHNYNTSLWAQTRRIKATHYTDNICNGNIKRDKLDKPEIRNGIQGSAAP